MLAPDPEPAAIELLYAELRIRERNLLDSGGLARGHVVEYAEGTDDDAGQQQSAEIDVRPGKDLHVECLFRPEPEEFSPNNESIGKGGGEAKNADSAGKCDGRAPMEPLRKKDGKEREPGRANDWNEALVAPFSICGTMNKAKMRMLTA